MAVPKPPQPRLLPPEAGVKVVQQSLIDLGYLLPGDDDGRFGPATQNAILAFQKWERLGRTGLLDAATKTRLATATHPTPITQGAAGKRAEVLIDRQVALLINNNQVVRTIAVSTGQALDADAAGRLPRLREDPALVVDAVPRVASVGRAVRRRHRLP